MSQVVDRNSRISETSSSDIGPAMRVVVAHHARQHSHQLATGLANAGALAKYITGVPTHHNAGWWWSRPLLRRVAGHYALPLDPALVRHVLIAPLAAKAATPVLSRRAKISFEHRAAGWFDAYAARLIDGYRPTLVIAYENAALKLFQRARQLGAITVLDAASFHHTWQDRFYHPAESSRAHERIVARKDAELALADHVLTVSEYARESYLDAGVPAERVHALPLGASLQTFRVPRTESPQDLPLRFLFVGHIDERKGVDVLFKAARRLAGEGYAFELSLIGKRNSDVSFADVPNLRHLGWMPQQQLAAEFARHDVLVLPSRHDSFGMVVAEAMAGGLPVILSDHVGAKELVTPGTNGEIVPAEDAAALAGAMAGFIAHREQLPLMRASARAVAEQFRWQSYHERALSTLRTIAQLHSTAGWR